jgi:hypothetical protein
LLSDGEYVIKAASVDKFGTGFLDSVNAGQLPGYRLGGLIRDGGGSSKSKPAPAKPASMGRVSADTAERRAQAAKPTTSEALFQAASQRQQEAFDRAQYVAKSQVASRQNVARQGEAFAGLVKNTIFDWTSPEMMALSLLPFGIGKGLRAAAPAATAATQATKNTPSGLKNFINFRRKPDQPVLSDISDIGVLEQYVANAGWFMLPSFVRNRMHVDQIIRSNNMGIPKGSNIVRVANEHDAPILQLLKPGQAVTLDRFMSVTSASSREFIEGMSRGAVQTGGRGAGFGGAPYPMMRFNVKSDIPGIEDINRIIPNPQSNVVDGLIARGQNMRLIRITTNRQTGQQTYHFDIGQGIRANTGFNQLGGRTYQEQLRQGLLREGRPDLIQPSQTGLGGMNNMSEWMPRYFAKGGTVKSYAKGGLATNKFAMGGLVSPKYFAMGGLVSPKYFADGGMAQGTDTVPAMLTPGEFVVNKKATDMYGPLLAAMNSSPAANLSMMGSKTFSEPVYNMPSREYADVGGNVGIYSSSNNSPSLTALDNSVYNYSLSVNVEGTNASANDIANVVMNKIKTIDSQQLRRQVLR